MINAFSQTKLLTGIVTDATGNPIAKASVAVKGAQVAAITSPTGAYQILLANEQDTIVCSHLDFQSKVEVVEGNTIINFTLHPKEVQSYKVTFSESRPYTPEEALKYKERQTQLQKASSKQKPSDGKQRPPAVEEEPIYPTLVHIQAAFRGGEPALQRYFQKHIIYPDSATVSDVQGTIRVGFTIDRDGSVKNVKLIKGVNSFADAAVVRAVEKMPLWIAAQQNGSRVPEYKEVTIFFTMKGVDTMKF